MLDPNARSVEEDMKLAEAEGYTLITDESTMEGLVEEHNFMERWHNNKNKLKPYLVCKLKCAKDHNVKGKETLYSPTFYVTVMHCRQVFFILR